MKRVLFACDLDNTLLTSRKNRQDGDICAELLDGEEISFFTPRTAKELERLIRCEELCFLPVTSRSTEQYQRIALPAGIDSALVSNGAILLRGERRDEEWDKKTRPFTEKAAPETRLLFERYKDDARFSTVRIVDDIFLFAACRTAEEAQRVFPELKAQTELCLSLTGRKLYWFHSGCDKGRAVKEFALSHGFERVVAAGDSEIDIPMLNVADTAIVPDKALAERLCAREILVAGKERFSEFVTEQVSRLLIK